LLASPLRLDVDATYYLSVLVCRQGTVRQHRKLPPPPNYVGVHFRDDDEVRRETPHRQPDLNKRLTVSIGQANLLRAKLESSGPQQQLTLSYNEPYLLVAKIVASAASPDQVLVRVYGIEDTVDAAEPANWTLEGSEVNSNRTFEWLEIEINSPKRQTLDELRLGSSWSAVTGPYLVQPAPQQP
jgi:hypothetical protein